MSPSSDPTERLRAHFRRERQAVDRHPAPEQIVAYHERRLAADEAEQIRAHLVDCPDCTVELLELAALVGAEDDPAPDLSSADVEAAWQRQRRRLFPSPVAQLDPGRFAARPLRRAWATAASLGLAAALLAGVVVVQWRTIARLEQPQANLPLVNLVPSGSVRQGAPAIRELQLPADAPRAWVILNPDAEAVFDSYDVDVFGPGREVVLRFDDLPISEKGNFRLEIPRAVLSAGDYRFVLSGRKEGQRRGVGEFALRVRPLL